MRFFISPFQVIAGKDIELIQVQEQSKDLIKHLKEMEASVEDKEAQSKQVAFTSEFT